MKRIIGLLLALMMALSVGITSLAEEDAATREQLTALAMLNHLTVLTQETNDSKNSRLFMETAYSELINNTYPNSVDSRTLSRLTRLLDTMEKYRMISVKRERLQYIYEQNQAEAIRAAIPNPLGMLSAAQSLSPARLIASVVYMAVDSVSSYESSKAQAELQYLQDGWALDDEEAEELHQSRKDMFSHMVNIVNDYKFDGDLALNEEAVIEFSRWKYEDNVVARIQFLESNKKTYQSYGGYWLALAEAYYNIGEMSKCLDSVAIYEGMAARIFRRDFEYAKVLPLAIAAAEECLSDDDYVLKAPIWAEALLDNIRNEDWALRYFAAQMFVNLYDKTGNKEYLQCAYNEAVNNVTNLLYEQKKMNKTYLEKVQEITTPKDATKEKKEEIKTLNTMLRETRKTELAPVSNALTLNCDLLFSLADIIEIDDIEKNRINNILHPGNARLFIPETVDKKYWFNLEEETPADDVPLIYNGTVMVVPAMFYTKDTEITVTVKEKGSEESFIITDWAIDKVERQEEDNVATYFAYLVSEDAKKHAWGPESEITITTSDGYTFNYTTQNVKTEWYDYVIKPFSGHKNEWYDYLKVWDNPVEFIRIYTDGSTLVNEEISNPLSGVVIIII